MRADVKGSRINEELLKRAILDYHAKNSTDPEYLVMSIETRDALVLGSEEARFYCLGERKTTLQYAGIAIAICNGLNFGEVDII